KGELASLDDCYYSQKAKEIVQTGDWKTMHYNGNPDFDNVPMYMWLQAALFGIFGVHEYTARFFSAFFGVLTILMVYIIAKKWYNERIAVYSGIVMLTTQFFLKFARRAMFDVTFTFFVTMAVFLFWKSLNSKSRKNLYILGYSLFIACSILTKSVLGLFPVIICGAYLLFSGQWKIIFSARYIFGSILGIALGSCWYMYEYALYGDVFLNQHFGWLIWERAFETNPQQQHWYSFLWYFWKLIDHYLPWVFFAFFGIYKMIRMNLKKINHTDILLLCWFFVVVLIMSIANEKKVWYIMSVFPALAIISGNVLDTVLKKSTHQIKFLKTSLGFFLLAVIIFAATPVRLDTNRHPDLKIIAQTAKQISENTETVYNYKLPYWGTKPVFLFYSDIDLTETYKDTDILRNEIPDDTDVFFLTEEQYVSELIDDPLLETNILIQRGRFIYGKIKRGSR
ncbi:ArnT family glycosyltransferase, partial [candidate division KSB1 bacterium]